MIERNEHKLIFGRNLHNDYKYPLKLKSYVNLLSNKSGQEILIKDGDKIRQRFQTFREHREAMVVIICTYNEEDDLPRLLASLSFSDFPIIPLIVDNNSTDNTTKVAKSFNLITISEKKQGLINARNKGMLYAVENMDSTEVLLVDADGIAGSLWALSLVNLMADLSDKGGVVYGDYKYYGGNERNNHFLNSIFHFYIFYSLIMRGKPSTHGGNFGVKFDKEGYVFESLQRLNPNIATGTNFALQSAVSAAGGSSIRTLHQESLVYTKSDRYPSNVLRTGFKLLTNHDSLYLDWYLRQKSGFNALKENPIL